MDQWVIRKNEKIKIESWWRTWMRKYEWEKKNLQNLYRVKKNDEQNEKN